MMKILIIQYLINNKFQEDKIIEKQEDIRTSTIEKGYPEFTDRL